jgi:thymidine phosphorylase
MLPVQIIQAKRDGGTLSAEQIQFFVRGLTDESWSEGAVAALAMAILIRGMQRDEVVALTRAMLHSGDVMDWSQAKLPGPVTDKHSTGGVGDKVSLMLAPIVAACGGVVPMVSGRGLGHTGGTLDKMQAIPGYDVAPPRARLEGVLLDVKVGNGAFADNLPMARELATSLVQVANAAGLPTEAVLTDMNEVLGTTAGNALELQESLDFLDGTAREPRLLEVTLVLAAQMLRLAGLAPDHAQARAAAEGALTSGRAAERFARMVALLGGPADVFRAARALPAAPVQRELRAPRAGVITAMNTRAIGHAVVALGGGRLRASDAIDPRVGLSHCRPIGSVVQAGEPLLRVHAASDAAADEALATLGRLVTVGDGPAQPGPVIVETITG